MRAADVVFMVVSRGIKVGPGVGQFLVSPDPSAEFAGLGSGTTGGVAAAVIRDPLFTVPVGGAQVPTVFIVGITNTRNVADTFTLDVTGLPPGFTADTSLPRIIIPAGATAEVGICLHPTAGGPPAGGPPPVPRPLRPPPGLDPPAT